MCEKNRYSNDELQEFKAIILDKLEKAQKDYVMYKSAITHSDGNGDDDTSPTFKTIEDAKSSLSKEEAGKLAQRQQKFIQYLQAALVRIENKTYGICTTCAKLILKERLFSTPHASMCMDCKEPEKNNKKVYAYATLN